LRSAYEEQVELDREVLSTLQRQPGAHQHSRELHHHARMIRRESVHLRAQVRRERDARKQATRVLSSRAP
jgi:hypothetical protein